jgi:signal transduction histidine kinase
MQIARNIYSADGKVLLAEDVSLTDNYISSLKELGIMSLYITDHLIGKIEVDDLVRVQTKIEANKVVKESMSNIKKHANAQNAVVSLEFTDKDLKLYIYDDGKGFNVNESKPKADDINSGFGLYSIKERVELLEGEIAITSEAGKGTRINITIPLVQNEEEKNG